MIARNSKELQKEYGISCNIMEELDYSTYYVYHKYPCIWLVDGGQGTGKTTAAVRFLEFMQRKPIDYSCQLALGMDEWIAKTDQCAEKGLRVCIWDEGDEFSMDNTNTKRSKDFKTRLGLIRRKKITILYLIQQGGRADKFFRSQRLIWGMFHIANRDNEKAEVWLYSYKDLSFMWNYYPDVIMKEEVYKMVYPTDYGWSLNLDPQRAAELENHSNAGKDRQEEQIDAKMNPVQQGEEELYYRYKEARDKGVKIEDMLKAKMITYRQSLKFSAQYRLDIGMLSYANKTKTLGADKESKHTNIVMN
jgi:hypothetical protein